MKHIDEKPVPFAISGWYTTIAAIFLFLFCACETYGLYQDYDALNVTESEKHFNWIMLIVYTVLGIGVPLALTAGNTTLQTNKSMVLTFMGKYVGTLKSPGYYAIPFWWRTYSERDLSIKTIRVTGITVNKKGENPIIIGCDIFCYEVNTAIATFNIQNLDDYLQSKAEVALRSFAMQHLVDGKNDEVSLRGSAEKIIEELQKEISAEYKNAGYKVDKATLTTLSFAPEIAGMMLQRQQAKAMVEARGPIAKGAILIIQETLRQLEEKNVATFNDEQKQALVAGLLISLYSSHSVHRF